MTWHRQLGVILARPFLLTKHISPSQMATSHVQEPLLEYVLTSAGGPTLSRRSRARRRYPRWSPTTRSWRHTPIRTYILILPSKKCLIVTKVLAPCSIQPQQATQLSNKTHDKAPPRLRITRRLLKQYGYTDGCGRCTDISKTDHDTN